MHLGPLTDGLQSNRIGASDLRIRFAHFGEGAELCHVPSSYFAHQRQALGARHGHRCPVVEFIRRSAEGVAEIDMCGKAASVRPTRSRAA